MKITQMQTKLFPYLLAEDHSKFISNTANLVTMTSKPLETILVNTSEKVGIRSVMNSTS